MTPAMGLAILLGSALGAYIVPIVFLRREIVELKRTTLKRLWNLQENQYAQIAHGAEAHPTVFARANEALEYFDKARRRVDDIPNYPHISRILKTLGIAITPSLISIGLSLRPPHPYSAALSAKALILFMPPRNRITRLTVKMMAHAQKSSSAVCRMTTTLLPTRSARVVPHNVAAIIPPKTLLVAKICRRER